MSKISPDFLHHICVTVFTHTLHFDTLSASVIKMHIWTALHSPHKCSSQSTPRPRHFESSTVLLPSCVLSLQYLHEVVLPFCFSLTAVYVPVFVLTASNRFPSLLCSFLPDTLLSQNKESACRIILHHGLCHSDNFSFPASAIQSIVVFREFIP